MMLHLGFPEDADALDQRHERYLALSASGVGEMFTIVYGADAATVGTIGYWRKTWRDAKIFETGRQVFHAYAGKGLATQAAIVVIALARTHGSVRYLHAFPSISNTASNRVCQRAGFTNLGLCHFEYPKGRFMQSNDWRYDLSLQFS